MALKNYTPLPFFFFFKTHSFIWFIFRMAIIFLFILSLFLFLLKFSDIKTKYGILKDTFVKNSDYNFNTNLKTNLKSNVEISHIPTVLPAPTGKVNWEYVIDQTCNAQLPIPPRIFPYYVDPSQNNNQDILKGSIWYAEKLDDSLYFFNHHAKIGFKQFLNIPTEDIVSVHVYCTDKKLYQNDIEIIKAIQNVLQKKENTLIDATTKQRDADNGILMTIVRFSTGQKYYLFTKNNKHYLIQISIKTQEKQAIDMAYEVFDKLQF